MEFHRWMRCKANLYLHLWMHPCPRGLISPSMEPWQNPTLTVMSNEMLFLVLNGMCVTSIVAALQTRGDWTGVGVHVSRWMCQNRVALLRRANKPAPSKGLVWVLPMRKQKWTVQKAENSPNVARRGKKKTFKESYLKQSKTDTCFGSSTRYFKPSLLLFMKNKSYKTQFWSCFCCFSLCWCCGKIWFYS